MAKTMYWQTVPGIVHVVVHSAEAPSDEDWIGYLESIVPHMDGIRGLLVYTDKTGPTTQQRRRANEHWQRVGRTPKISVMTNDRFTRGIVTALKWVIGNHITAFPIDDFEGAAKNLDLTEVEGEQVKQVIAELAAQANVEVVPFR